MNENFCQCKFPKTKVIRTHGRKARGYLVCRRCGKLVKRK